MSAAALQAELDALGLHLPVEWWPEVDSTNAELLRRGAAQPDFAVLIADAQHAGRGRRGRVWLSPPGANLYLSLYVALPGGALQAGGLSLAVGAATAEALHALGATSVRLKWPNDLLAGGRKLGGILVELGAGGAVVGLGINLRMPPDTAPDQPWCDLAGLGLPLTRERLAAAVLARLVPTLQAFRLQGLDAPLRARWEALHAHADCAVRIAEPGGDWEGRALGLDADGALRVATLQGIRRVRSGEVSLRPA